MRSHFALRPIVAGLVLVAIGLLVQNVMPVLGRAAFQAAAAGSYSPSDYRVPLVGFYLIAGVLIAIGVVLTVLECRRTRR